jgi:hypothetical protein
VEDGLAVKEVPHVPAIEDYIVPRRLPEAIDYRVSSVTSHFSHNGRDAHYHPPLESRHSTSPFSSHSRAHDIRSVRLPHEYHHSMPHFRQISISRRYHLSLQSGVLLMVSPHF